MPPRGQREGDELGDQDDGQPAEHRPGDPVVAERAGRQRHQACAERGEAEHQGVEPLAYESPDLGHLAGRVDLLDLRWVAPLPEADLVRHATAYPRVVVVDETRRSGGVSEGVVSALVDAGYPGRISRVTSQDSVIPLGPGAAAVLLSEDEIAAALQEEQRG